MAASNTVHYIPGSDGPFPSGKDCMYILPNPLLDQIAQCRFCYLARRYLPLQYAQVLASNGAKVEPAATLRTLHVAGQG